MKFVFGLLVLVAVAAATVCSDNWQGHTNMFRMRKNMFWVGVPPAYMVYDKTNQVWLSPTYCNDNVASTVDFLGVATGDCAFIDIACMDQNPDQFMVYERSGTSMIYTLEQDPSRQAVVCPEALPSLCAGYYDYCIVANFDRTAKAMVLQDKSCTAPATCDSLQYGACV